MERFPSIPRFWKGVKEFRAHEKRDAMYRVATRLVNDYWGEHKEVADGLGVLLLTWNQALYRYGIFDFEKLEKFLRKRHREIGSFRSRNILSWTEQDDLRVKALFDELLDVLASIGKESKLKRSPVAVTKALHILALDFFPLWDNAIAEAYSCYWYEYTRASEKYLCFCKKIIDFYKYLVKNKVRGKEGVSLLKIIDEYNYSKYTQGWIKG